MSIAPTVRYGNPDAASRGYYEHVNDDVEEFVDVHPVQQKVGGTAGGVGTGVGAGVGAGAGGVGAVGSGSGSAGLSGASANMSVGLGGTSTIGSSSNTNVNNPLIAAPPSVSVVNPAQDDVDTNDEEAKLRAVIPGQSTSTTGSMYGSNAMGAGLGSAGGTSKFPVQSGMGGGGFTNKFKHSMGQQSSRPNADPTLREQEQLQMQDNRPKRTTGLPRTFRPQNDEKNSKAVQVGFKNLVENRGGQSESGGGKKQTLEYALQLTATSIPEHYQCGICAGVAKDALFIPWDDEGRTACDLCMRKGLSENRLRCPLTGQDGVSPDDLRPNKPLRKAIDEFVRGVMEKMQEIVQQQEDEEEQDREEKKMTEHDKGLENYEGDTSEKGLIMRKGMAKRPVRQKSVDDFGGEDDFGGDVFDVFKEEEEEETAKEEETFVERNQTGEKSEEEKETEDNTISKNIADDVEKTNADEKSASVTTNLDSKNDVDSSSSLLQSNEGNKHDVSAVVNTNENDNNHNTSQKSNNPSDQAQSIPPTKPNRREMMKNRGPPAGYVMGPAGSNVNNTPSPSSTTSGNGYQSHFHQGRGGRGMYNGGRGFNQYGRGRGYFNKANHYHQQQQQQQESNSEVSCI